ncbi:MAG: MG2 domain-containing protein [Prolixibacteraceae bacterium]|nr:MG2 domain-containing protein [Prolixibacteraceae bacterium]
MKKILLFIPILASFLLQAQTNEKEILKNYAVYQSVHHQEKIFVQTDRPAYLAGEDLWLSAFVLDVGSQKLNNSENVLYVELVNPGGQTVQKQIFEITGGRAWGNITLDEDLLQGSYHLVAYTNWMRNTGSEFYFSKRIHIVGQSAFVLNDTSSIISVEIETSSTNIDESDRDMNITVQFYPEGGDLIEGLTSKVAFEATDENNNRIQLNGLVFDANGQMVAAANSLWRGKGVFTITPQAGNRYYLQVDDEDGEPKRFALPLAKTSGMGLSLIDLPRKDELNIIVQSSRQLTDSTAFLLATQNGKPQKAIVLNLSENNPVSVQISKSEFRTGIVQFTLFDANKVPQSERLFFVKNNDSISLSLTMNKLPYGAREKAEFTLMAVDSQGNPLSGDFALSITDAGRVPEVLYRSPGIFSYLSLYADLPYDNTPDAALFKNTGEGNYKTELLMLTNGWRRYAWNEILSDTIPVPKFLEEPGIYVKGTVRTDNKYSKVPDDAVVTMITQSGKMELFSETVGENGVFTFLLRDFEGTLRAAVQTKNRMGNKKDYALELHTNYQKQPVDSYRHLILQDTSVVGANFKDFSDSIALERGELAKVLSRKMREDSFMISTDYAIEEVVVEGKTTGNYKEEITKNYGSPDYSIGEKRIQELVEQKPWQYGLFSILSNAFPDLSVETSQSTLTHKPGTNPQGSNIVASDSPCITFSLVNKRKHRFFVFVDGQMVAASDAKGLISSIYSNYSIEDLIGLDPGYVKSLDLIFPKNNNAQNALNSEADIYEYEQKSSIDVDMDMMLAELADESEKITAPVAVLSIYTKTGAGLLGSMHTKGIANITLHGFARTKEFYNPDYSMAENDSVLYDLRNTLTWYPQLKTDSTGKADFSFYTSDVSGRIRLEANGLSDNGVAGNLVFKIPDQLFDAKNADEIITAAREMKMEKNQFKPMVMLPDSAAAAFALVKVLSTGQTTFTSLSGRFSLDENHVNEQSKIEISKPGYKSETNSYIEINKNGVVLQVLDDEPSGTSIEDIMDGLYRNHTKNRNSGHFFIEGAFREQLFSGSDLHKLTDFFFIQRWQKLSEPNARIETRMYNGREFQSNRFNTIISFTPQNRFNDAVPVMDPQFADISFLSRSFKKHYNYKLEGETSYQGRKVYHVAFDQEDDLGWALYKGEMFIDKETFGLAWCRWKISEKGEKYLMPDEYLSGGGDAKSFVRVFEHNEISYGFNGSFWIPQFATANLRFEQQEKEFTIVREMVWLPTDKAFSKFTALLPGDMNRRAILMRKPVYKPFEWRHPWLLPPDDEIEKQIRYLNNTIEYRQ